MTWPGCAPLVSKIENITDKGGGIFSSVSKASRWRQAKQEMSVCGGGWGCWRHVPKDPCGFLETLFLTRENPACSAQATQTPSLLKQYNQPPSPPTLCTQGHPQDLKLEMQSSLPVLCLLSMWRRYSEWTVNRILTQLLRNRLELLVLCVCWYD